MPPADSPVVIVVAAGTLAPLEGDASPAADGADGADALVETLNQALATQMPVLVLAPAGLVPVAARAVARRDVLVLPEPQPAAAGTPPAAASAGTASRVAYGADAGTGAALAAAVSQRADAAGWIVVPAGCAAAIPSTLQRIGEALRQHPVAYAQSQGRRMYPVGFASGLFSDLMALAVNEGPRRLAARFPGFAVELDATPQALAT